MTGYHSNSDIPATAASRSELATCSSEEKVGQASGTGSGDDCLAGPFPASSRSHTWREEPAAMATTIPSADSRSQEEERKGVKLLQWRGEGWRWEGRGGETKDIIHV